MTCSKSCSAYPHRAEITYNASKAPTSATIALSKKVNSSGRCDRWNSTTAHRPSCSFRKAGVVDDAGESTTVGSPPRLRPSASQSRTFPPSGHSMRGCRLETCTMTAIRFAGCTKVATTRYAEGRIDFSQAYRGLFQFAKFFPVVTREERIDAFGLCRPTDLILIGTIPVPISKDKCSPVARREKRRLVRLGATIFKKEAIR